MTGASGVETGVAQGGLLPMLQELDRLLESAVAAAPAFYGWDAGRDAFRGLYINEQDARRTLLRGPCSPPVSYTHLAARFACTDAPPIF